MVEILRVLQLLVSIALASQGIFYFLGLARAVSQISIGAFAEQRNSIDRNIAGKLKSLYYGALILGVLLMVLLRERYDSFSFVCIALSTFSTLVDMLLARKFNIPINKAFRSYPAASHDWDALRSRWIRFLMIRSVFSIGAMFLLQVSLIVHR